MAISMAILISINSLNQLTVLKATLVWPKEICSAPGGGAHFRALRP
jgi:hypothetical protein